MTRTRRPRVAYWNNIPSPYMVDRFNAVADRRALEFEAWFSTRTESDRSWAVDESSWRFQHAYLPGVGIGQRRLELPTRLLGRERPDLLVSLYASPSFVLGSTMARWSGTKIAYWTEVTFDTWVPRSAWKEALKRWMLPRADGVLTPGPDGKRFAEMYGALSQRIYQVAHTIDVTHFSRGAEAARHRRSAIRAKLGVRGCTFVYVGRLWDQGKGLRYLLAGFAAVSRILDTGMTLLLVGDGPDEQRLRRRVTALGLNDKVVFAGFVPSTDLPRILGASDVFVFPTLGDPYGLALDEAMAASLPIISTSAAGELHLRVVNGQNGFVVPPADSREFADAMARLARDPALRAQMGHESRLMVEGRTPERWAEDFEQAVASILGSARYR